MPLATALRRRQTVGHPDSALAVDRRPTRACRLPGPHQVFYTGLVPSGRRTQLPWGGLGGRVPAAEAQVRWAASPSPSHWRKGDKE
jgi:hypothetical protein